MENFIGFLGILLIALMTVALFRKRSRKDLKPEYLELLERYQGLYKKLSIDHGDAKMILTHVVQFRELRSGLARHLIPEDSELASDSEVSQCVENLLKTMDEVQLKLVRASQETSSMGA